MKLELFRINEIALAYNLHHSVVRHRIERLKLIPYKKQNTKTYYFSREQVRKIITYNENKPVEYPFREEVKVLETWYVFPSRMNWDKSI
jgi:hypothetical protein